MLRSTYNAQNIIICQGQPKHASYPVAELSRLLGEEELSYGMVELKLATSPLAVECFNPQSPAHLGMLTLNM